MPEGPAIVLAARDDGARRRLLDGVRGHAPLPVAEAGSGLDVLRLARQAPRLIVLDADLPDLDGREVCRRLKADAATATIPVVLLVDDPAELDGQAWSPAAPDACVPRPAGPEALAASIGSLLRSHDAASRSRAEAAFWTHAFDALSEGVALVTPDGVILRGNSALARLLQMRADELPGRDAGELIGGRAEPEDRPHLRAARTRRRALDEWAVGHRLFRVAADPMLGDDGEAIGVVVMVADITNQRRLREQVDRNEGEARASRDRIEQLEREARVLQHFAAAGPAAPAAGGPLRASAVDTFCELVVDYERLLERTLEQREFKVYHKISDDLRAMADRLGLLGAGPRDVVEVHGTALRRKAAGLPPLRSHALSEEGRLLVLELMGYLAAHYRARALGARRGPDPRGDAGGRGAVTG